MAEYGKKRFLVLNLCDLLLVLSFHILNGNIVPFGQELDGFHEGKILFLHDECDGIAATVTAETVEQVLSRTDRKGAGPLLMERTNAHQGRAFP